MTQLPLSLLPRACAQPREVPLLRSAALPTQGEGRPARFRAAPPEVSDPGKDLFPGDSQQSEPRAAPRSPTRGPRRLRLRDVPHARRSLPVRVPSRSALRAFGTLQPRGGGGASCQLTAALKEASRAPGLCEARGRGLWGFGRVGAARTGSRGSHARLRSGPRGSVPGCVQACRLRGGEP